VGKKKSTPPELDFLFDRDIISEDDYGGFWQQWWKADKERQREIIDGYLKEEMEEAPGAPQVGSLTKDKKLAEFQAKLLNGYVVRRNKKGQFSKRGKIFQAMKPRRK
jgi:hypothetical protein